MFRGIKFSQKPKFLSDIIYPPKEKAKLNRASEDAEQMFYASTSKKAVLYELDVSPGDKMVISMWRLNNMLVFNNVGYTKANLAALGATREIPTDEDNDNPINNLIADYLALAFCQNISELEKYLYKLTIAIARIHLKEAGKYKFAGLYYPTIRLNGEEENFAINKNIIDLGLLDFIGIQFIQIVEKLNNRYKYTILDTAEEITNYSINWNDSVNQWTVYEDSEELYFIEDNGSVLAYNQDGDQIPPD